MTQSEISQTSTERSIRERVGFAVVASSGADAVDKIVAAETAGVQQIWMTQGAPTPDTLTIFAAAAARTSSVRLGTAIVPVYPRHPLSLAQQALALSDLAPGRLRLGVGSSHRPTIERVYGLPFTSPLAYLREYVAVLRAALWKGNVDHHGHFFNVVTTLPHKPEVPILISALREGAFRLAGEISDGGISWLCPVSYLLDTALPALRAGAASLQRPAPPVVAHVLVALGQDRHKGLAVARQMLGRYAALPFYANMFADAGFPVAPNGVVSDALVDNLVISGDEAAVAARFQELLVAGLDELLVFHVPVTDPDRERAQLMDVIGHL
ncbi:MAG TPA: LLM class flavin-dependent oxidoreductase [Ktedonobacteraceae bacterium]|nr:LLM class flavin-dependent oxidoreductase [Ktedonobacteraceae bacterium]